MLIRASLKPLRTNIEATSMCIVERVYMLLREENEPLRTHIAVTSMWIGVILIIAQTLPRPVCAFVCVCVCVCE